MSKNREAENHMSFMLPMVMIVMTLGDKKKEIQRELLWQKWYPGFYAAQSTCAANHGLKYVCVNIEV